jgi:hypothetical protein
MASCFKARPYPYKLIITKRRITVNQQQTAPAPANLPLHDHGAFRVIDASLNRIRLMADALHGLGNLMQPETNGADEQLNMTRRSDVSAIFEFFGDVLSESREIVAEAADTLQYKAEHVCGIKKEISK